MSAGGGPPASSEGSRWGARRRSPKAGAAWPRHLRQWTRGGGTADLRHGGRQEGLRTSAWRAASPRDVALRDRVAGLVNDALQIGGGGLRRRWSRCGRRELTQSGSRRAGPGHAHHLYSRSSSEVMRLFIAREAVERSTSRGARRRGGSPGPMATEGVVGAARQACTAWCPSAGPSRSAYGEVREPCRPSVTCERTYPAALQGNPYFTTDVACTGRGWRSGRRCWGELDGLYGASSSFRTALVPGGRMVNADRVADVPEERGQRLPASSKARIESTSAGLRQRRTWPRYKVGPALHGGGLTTGWRAGHSGRKRLRGGPQGNGEGGRSPATGSSGGAVAFGSPPTGSVGGSGDRRGLREDGSAGQPVARKKHSSAHRPAT